MKRRVRKVIAAIWSVIARGGIIVGMLLELHTYKSAFVCRTPRASWAGPLEEIQSQQGKSSPGPGVRKRLACARSAVLHSRAGDEPFMNCGRSPCTCYGSKEYVARWIGYSFAGLVHRFWYHPYRGWLYKSTFRIHLCVTFLFEV